MYTAPFPVTLDLGSIWPLCHFRYVGKTQSQP